MPSADPTRDIAATLLGQLENAYRVNQQVEVHTSSGHRVYRGRISQTPGDGVLTLSAWFCPGTTPLVRGERLTLDLRTIGAIAHPDPYPQDGLTLNI